MDAREEPFLLPVPTGPGEPGRAIRGVVTRPAEVGPAGAPFVLVVHGFKGFFRWGFFPELCARLTAAGLSAVAFNVSGSGVGEDLLNFTDERGFEANTYSRELEDIARVRDAVEAGKWSWVDQQRGGIFGHSRGGAMALVHAAERPGLRALAAWAAIERVVRWDAATAEQWRRDGVLLVPNARTGQIHRLGLGLLADTERHAARLDVEAACRRLSLPVLLLHGGADDSVEPVALERLAAALPGAGHRAQLVPGANHTFGARHPLQEVPPELEHALSETVAWFVRHLGPGGTRRA